MWDERVCERNASAVPQLLTACEGAGIQKTFKWSVVLHESWSDDKRRQRVHVNKRLCHKQTGDSRSLRNASRFTENWNVSKIKLHFPEYCAP